MRSCSYLHGRGLIFKTLHRALKSKHDCSVVECRLHGLKVLFRVVVTEIIGNCE